jgi:16S rRNA (guanine527-N7)-methyltransferase
MIRDVSRETPPLGALELFGDRLELAGKYAELLTSAGVERGLLGPQEAQRVWDRHLLNCGVAAIFVPSGATVCDVGSGAGLPGIVWAILRQDVAITLVEPMLKRSRFLIEAVEELELSNVTIVRARAEGLRGAMVFDVATARAVAPLDRLVGWLLPLVHSGGLVLALKGASAAEELAGARKVLARLGVGASSVERCGAGLVDPATTVIRLVKSEG